MTLRTRLFVIGAIRGADARQQVLRLGLRGRWRKRFAALLGRIGALPISTVGSSPQTIKILCPGLGNRLPRASKRPHFRHSNEFFELNKPFEFPPCSSTIYPDFASAANMFAVTFDMNGRRLRATL
jgi:hypothetical protein